MRTVNDAPTSAAMDATMNGIWKEPVLSPTQPAKGGPMSWATPKAKVMVPNAATNALPSRASANMAPMVVGTPAIHNPNANTPMITRKPLLKSVRTGAVAIKINPKPIVVWRER